MAMTMGAIRPVSDDGETLPVPGVLVPGDNCWRREHAPRAGVMVDAADYFRSLDEAIRKAERSILIVGWDFDGRICLQPDARPDETLGGTLRKLVEAKPGLEVRILVWSVAVVHGPGAPMPLLFGTDWERHPRISVRLDTQHPFYAAHHQKLVVLDDDLAFVGGIDLTVARWDTCEHTAGSKLRTSYDGTSYGPVHDLQMAVDGAAAHWLGEVARRRWKVACDETLAPAPSGRDLWPERLPVAFRDESIAIARTAPPWRGEPGVREAASLTRDALAAAERFIYVEAQYLTARYVRDVLLERLDEPDCPEILIVLTRGTGAFAETLIMGNNGNRNIRRLKRADKYGKLQVLYPVAPGKGPDGKDCTILVHSKLVICDDFLLRVGSSNMNNRSVGLDTECDVAIETGNPESRRTIAELRDRLIGEHLGVSGEAVTAVIAETGSMLQAVERLNCSDRCLRPFEAMTDDGPVRNFFGTWLLDPARPFEPFWFLNIRRRRPTIPRRRFRKFQRRSKGVTG